MGAKQSRVVTNEAAAELRPEDEHDGKTRASIRLTPALIDQINGTHEASAKAQQAAGGINAQYAGSIIVYYGIIITKLFRRGITTSQAAGGHEEAAADGLQQEDGGGAQAEAAAGRHHWSAQSGAAGAARQGAGGAREPARGAARGRDQQEEVPRAAARRAVLDRARGVLAVL
ncbi:hypothetical protein ON010_g14667 [Phytophthora cinnamomi]|nr:hypothetical protein ON010_g14667 [Phytophthora cinnamomi]